MPLLDFLDYKHQEKTSIIMLNYCLSTQLK